MLFDTDCKSNKQWRAMKGCELLQPMIYLTQDQQIYLLILSINKTMQCFSKHFFLRMPFHCLFFSLCALLSPKLYCCLSGCAQGGLTNIRRTALAGKKIILLINGVIKVLSLTWHRLTGIDGVLGAAPGSLTFHNEWQLLPSCLGGDGATCKGLASQPLLHFATIPLSFPSSLASYF